MFEHRGPLSAYLVQPEIRRQRSTSHNGLRDTVVNARRHNPRILSRSLVALAIWCTVVGAIQGVRPVDITTALPISPAAARRAALASTTPSDTNVTPPLLTTAFHANRLPDGPSGQLLPPGTMAPDRTFKNSYAYGQCTWYVAGRRQIPGGWGNAASWYYHAAASGWSVGNVPAIAAIAQTNAGYYGHVALVEQISADAKSVYISEMNYRGIGIKSYRWVAANQFRYIY